MGSRSCIKARTNVRTGALRWRSSRAWLASAALAVPLLPSPGWPFALVALAAVAAVAAVACDDKPSFEVELARDRATLDRIVEADLELDRAMKRADDLSVKGDDTAAANALDKFALPRATAAAAQARTAIVTTPWAKDRVAEWLAIAADREREIPIYAAALRGEDMAAKLSALEAQASIQKRAMRAATAVKAGPDGQASAR